MKITIEVRQITDKSGIEERKIVEQLLPIVLHAVETGISNAGIIKDQNKFNAGNWSIEQ